MLVRNQYTFPSLYASPDFSILPAVINVLNLNGPTTVSENQ